MSSVGALIEKLLESPVADVNEAGAQLRRIISDDRLQSRYISQVAERALNADYETIEEIFNALQGLVDRDPPILEPKRQPTADRVVLPEVKVLQTLPTSFDALVTTGAFRDREIRIR